MEKAEKKIREPFMHIVKRTDVSFKKAILIRAIAILCATVVCGLIFVLLSGKNPFAFYQAIFEGSFGTPRRIWRMVHSLAILLCISLAVTPAFKMRFWNIGAEGQVLIGGLATMAVMYYLGGKVSMPVLWVLMLVSSIAASAIWAVIPAIFKAKWNTNETLFTLMMNYVATQLVLFFINTWVTSGSGVLAPLKEFGLPTISNAWLLNIITVAVLTVMLYIYLRYSKQGYEISVVGESENTARYIGISVKKVIIRTMIISGALCGVAGLLLVGGTDHTISANTVGGQGFTAIMVSWLGKFNPFYMVLTAFLIVFLQAGAKQVSTTFRLDEAISDIVTAVILFFIIGCEFFINYKIVFRNSAKEGK